MFARPFGSEPTRTIVFSGIELARTVVSFTCESEIVGESEIAGNIRVIVGHFDSMKLIIIIIAMREGMMIFLIF